MENGLLRDGKIRREFCGEDVPRATRSSNFAGANTARRPGFLRSMVAGIFLTLALAVSMPPTGSVANTVLQPTGDKYMYPFIIDSPEDSRRPYGSAFGAYGEIDTIPGWSFDDRDGQFFLDFQTQSLAPAGKGASNYRVLSLTLTIVIQNRDAFLFDPSFDALGTYNGSSSDGDLGRPIELYGVGYRAGWTRETFGEDSPFQTISYGSQNLTRVRNAFALDFASNGTPRDVSNNVEEGFETNPWAVADSPGFIDLDGVFQSSPLAAGSPVPEGRVFRFQVNPANPHIAAYLNDALHAGRLHLMVSSLYETTQQSPDIPKFYTKENELHDPNNGSYLAPQLHAEVLVLPTVSIAPIAGGFRVGFDTIARQKYQVQYRESLTSGNWSPLGEVRDGTGGTLSHDHSTSNSLGFYRVSISK